MFMCPQDEAAALKKKNDELREEVERLKAELENWEVKNGCKNLQSPLISVFYEL